MKDLNGESILKIPLGSPEKLFSGNLDIAKKEYHELSRKWHPDLSSEADAENVFKHVHALYTKAQELLKDGKWKGNGIKKFNVKGTIVEVSYDKVIPFEIGECFFGRKHIFYSVRREYDEYFRNAVRKIRNLSFPSDDMRRTSGIFLPINASFMSSKNSDVMLINKTEDMIPLRDLLNHFSGKIDPLHVAWIISSLYNIACCLNYSGLVHMNIDIDTCLVSPEHHAVYLFGGWWFTANKNDNFSIVPAKTAGALSPDVLREKKAKTLIDLDMIRYIGRELLGDRTGEQLKYDKSLPSFMVNWLRASTNGDAIEDYRLWREVLEKCFGKPRFIKMNLDIELFY